MMSTPHQELIRNQRSSTAENAGVAGGRQHFRHARNLNLCSYLLVYVDIDGSDGKNCPEQAIDMSIFNAAMSDQEIIDGLIRIKTDAPNSEDVAMAVALDFANSGKTYSPLGNSVAADVASTGGPTSLTTLLTPLFLRAAGLQVPKLGVPGKGVGIPSKSTDDLHALPERRSAAVKKIISLIPKNGGSRKDLPAKYQLDCHKKSDGFSDVYGRMSWNGVAPTMTSGCCNPSKGRFLHPSQDRNISLREAALLQGFPMDYCFDVSHGKEAIALMIGNALPPPFIAAHARGLLRAVRLQETTNS